MPNLDLYPVEKNAPGEQPGVIQKIRKSREMAPINRRNHPRRQNHPIAVLTTPKPQGPVNPGDNGSSGTGNHKNKNKNSKQSSVETGDESHTILCDRHAGCTGRSGYHYSAPQTEKAATIALR